MREEIRQPHGPLIALVTSHGGHLELLEALEPAWARHRRLWVTPPSRQADGLRARGEDVHLVTNPWRSPHLLARNLVEAARLVRRRRPDVVVTPGAGVAVPFCLAAKSAGVPLVYVETMARTQDGSVSGRVLYRVADRFLVQWESLRAVFPRAEVCRPALLEGIPAEPAPGGQGTFVSAGSHGKPFARLVALVDAAAGRGDLPSPVRVQGDPGAHRPRHVEVVPWLPPEAVRAAVRDSSVVVTHGGSGIISLALRGGRLPLVLPRRRRHGEHFDDHQVRMTEALERLGLAVSLETHAVPEAVRRSAHGPSRAAELLPGPPLARRLGEVIEELVAR